MASAWIFHDSAEYPPERTIATGMPRSRARPTTRRSRSGSSLIDKPNPASGSPTNGSEDAPVDHPGGQASDDRHLQDAGQHVLAAQRAEVFGHVQLRKVRTACGPRPHQVAAPAQATGDQGVVDAAALAAVEPVQPLQAAGRDVVPGVVDQGDHRGDVRCIVGGSGYRHRGGPRAASGLPPHDGRRAIERDDFYDRLAPLHDPIFSDWDASIERQAGQLAGIIHEQVIRAPVQPMTTLP
jgi:hypothetical protein